jgi:hypothetical protein
MPIRQPPDALTGYPTVELLEPFLWVHTIWHDIRAPLVITGTVKPPPAMVRLAAEDAEGAASVRRALFDRAQAAIATMEEAGYSHGWHPEFTIKGAEAELRLYLKPPRVPGDLSR